MNLRVYYFLRSPSPLLHVCFRGKPFAKDFCVNGEIARSFCRVNEKRGQPLEPFPFQSSKSWTPSFSASRLPARRHFSLEFFHFRRYHFFPRFPASLSLSLSLSHGHYHRRRAPLLMVFSRSSSLRLINKTIPLPSRSKLYRIRCNYLSPVTSLHLFNDGSSRNLSNIVDSPILIPHSIIHLHG